MFGTRGQDDDGIVSLVKETAEGLGRLLADHIKLARVEIVADAKAYGRHAGLMVVAAVFLLLGYAFAWLAAALALGRLVGLPLAALIVGGAHLLAGLVALVVVRDRLRKTRVMDGTVAEVTRSVATLRAPGRAAGVNGDTDGDSDAMTGGGAAP
jgi:hypothetical protein